jgi:hypothetical protein
VTLGGLHLSSEVEVFIKGKLYSRRLISRLYGSKETTIEENL